MSNTQRSLKLLRERGLICWKAEHYNFFSGRRDDAWGVFDILGFGAIDGDYAIGVLGIQTTSAAHISDRRKKIRKWHGFEQWKQSGNSILIHGWFKKANRWQVREESL